MQTLRELHCFSGFVKIRFGKENNTDVSGGETRKIRMLTIMNGIFPFQVGQDLNDGSTCLHSRGFCIVVKLT